MEPILSVIIPVYNVEKYLHRCLESIVHQKEFEQIELILVDDGSEDYCPQICDDYGNKYNNIRVFHKMNGGLSDARNYGIRNSTGKYLIFIDSDDMVSNDFFNRIFEALNDEVDILLWNANCIDENDSELKNIKYKFKYEGLNNNQIYENGDLIKEQLKKTNEFTTVVWLAAYKRELITKNNLWFEKDLLHEDEMWTIKTILCSKNIKYIYDNLYKYRKRENSIMRESKMNNINHIKSYIYIYSSLYSYYNWKVKDIELLKLLQDNVSKRYLYVISYWNFEIYKSELNKVNAIEILKYSTSWKNRIRAIVLCINKRIYCNLTKKMRYIYEYKNKIEKK